MGEHDVYTGLLFVVQILILSSVLWLSYTVYNYFLSPFSPILDPQTALEVVKTIPNALISNKISFVSKLYIVCVCLFDVHCIL